jgi:drug/metabolite transporter (DMT)-like permease
LAGAVFVGLILVKGWPHLPWDFHKRILTIAIFVPGLYFVFENFGIKYTTATKASLIAATIPIAVLIISTFILKEKIFKKQLICLFISLAGVVVLVLNGHVSGVGSFMISRGDLLMFGAVFSAAFYMILTRKLSEQYDPFFITAFQMIYGFLLFSPIFFFEVGKLQWTVIGLQQWGALFVLALLSSVGAFFAYNYALKIIPASRASMGINVVPFITAFCSWGLLGESLTIIQLSGGVLIIIAAFMVNLSSKGHEMHLCLENYFRHMPEAIPV